MSKTTPTPLVTVKTKYQLTLPTTVRRAMGVEVGDLLEAKVEGGKITFTPKSAIDRELALALEEVKSGRLSPVFDNVEESIRWLRAKEKKHRMKRRS